MNMKLLACKHYYHLSNMEKITDSLKDFILQQKVTDLHIKYIK
jgi:hypothetical protein